jgi:hypothetical protein
MYEDQYSGDYDFDFDREVNEMVAARHAEEDRLERELCAEDDAYASERWLREMGG